MSNSTLDNENEYVTVSVQVYERKYIPKDPKESLFEKELKRFADDYEITVEEAREVVANVAAMKRKHEIMHPGEPFEWF